MLLQKGLKYNPTLESVLTVEEFIKEHSGEYGRYQLWKKLPKGMMYQTFQTILDYLENSNKIITARDGKLVWIWNPKLVKKYLQRPDLIIR